MLSSPHSLCHLSLNDICHQRRNSVLLQVSSQRIVRFPSLKTLRHKISAGAGPEAEQYLQPVDDCLAPARIHGLFVAVAIHPRKWSTPRGRTCASARLTARGRTAGLDATPPLQHVQAAGSTARGRTCASAGSTSRGRTAGLDAAPTLEHIQAARVKLWCRLAATAVATSPQSSEPL